ncbi:hypothetical protein ACQKJG_18695 [Priestia megaterium]|uniref:hypothetical protein n=1 Tax=Priestia megaterium TaxID=1404 RepID=UPI003D0847DB
MIPYNVLARIDLPFVQSMTTKIRDVQLPLYRNVVKNEERQQECIRRSLINLVTFQHIKAVLVFTEEQGTLQLKTFETSHRPLSKLEARGAYALTMELFKQGCEVVKKIEIPKTECRLNKKPVISYMYEIEEANKPFFMILISSDFLFATGTYYNESAMCEALMKFCPLVPNKVIRTVSQAKDGLSLHKMRYPSFSVEVPQIC